MADACAWSRLRLAAAALALATSAACDPAIGHTYWLVGDSTSLQIAEQLTAVASWRHRGDVVIPLATVSGYSLGVDLSYSTGRLRSAAARFGSPSAVVVLLGTNDAVDDEKWALIDTNPEIDAAIRALIAAVPATSRVVWVLPVAASLDAGRRAHLAAALRRHRRIEIVAPDPAFFPPGDVHWGPEHEIDAVLTIVGHLDRGTL